MAANGSDSKVWAFLGVLLTVVRFILVLLLKKKDKYALFYAKQGLVIFVAYIIVAVVNALLMFLPFVGKFVGALLWAFVIVLWLIALINAASGEEKETPLIGEFARKIKV